MANQEFDNKPKTGPSIHTPQEIGERLKDSTDIVANSAGVRDQLASVVAAGGLDPELVRAMELTGLPAREALAAVNRKNRENEAPKTASVAKADKSRS